MIILKKKMYPNLTLLCSDDLFDLIKSFRKINKQVIDLIDATTPSKHETEEPGNPETQETRTASTPLQPYLNKIFRYRISM